MNEYTENISRRQAEAIGPENREASMPDSVKAYLQEISRYPLLTAEEEQRLSLRIQAGRDAEALLEDHRAGRKVLDLEELRAYRTLAEQGREAQNELVNCNLRLVVNLARSYANRGLPLLDLIQEGNLGLIKAAARYDGSTGNRFSTCAAWWIRQAISRAVADTGRTIRLPSYVIQDVSRVRKLRQTLSAELGREPTVQELAQAAELSPQKVQELLRAGQETTSLDLPVGDDDGATLADFVGAVTPMEDVEERLYHQQLSKALRTVLEKLEPRERQVLTLRYGLDGGEAQTLDAIGRTLGITRERARQIESKAMRKLRGVLLSRQLRDFIA